MTNMDEETNIQHANSTLYFCYRIVYYESMTYFAIFFCCLCLVLLVYAIYKFSLIEKIGASRQVRITYALIILWGLFYLAKLILADTTFFIYHPNPNDRNDRYLSIVSKYLFSLDISSVFILQTALVLIPFNWMKRIIDIFSQLTNYEERSTSNKQQKSDFRFQKRCIVLFRVYIYARLSYVILIIIFCAKQDQSIETKMASLFIITLLCETAILLGMLLLGLYSLSNNSKTEDLLDDAQLTTMKNQYTILIVSTAARLLNSGWYVYQNLRELGRNEHCNFDPSSDSRYPGIAPSIILFILQGLFTHLLPIFVILRIYRIKKSSIELSQSLLIPAQKTSQQQ